MQVVRLKAQNKANVGLNPKNNTIYLSEPSGGIPYVELSNITVNDWYKNSHIKTLSGIYTGGRPTSIKVRDHYPHSIGTGWCRLSNLMTSESGTTRVNVRKKQEFIPIVGEENYTCFKETAFWGAANTLITVNDIEVANSMRYDTIEPYAPEEGSANYYGDRMEAVGVPMPTTPSPWYYGTIDYDEQTWEVEITLNPFTMFEKTAYQQMYNYWKPYHVTSYPVGLNYDPRLHAIEVDIASSYNGETIHGKRIYYIWHVPQCFPIAKVPQIELTTGTYSGPFNHHICGGGLGAQYDTGYTASGGTGKIELQANEVKYENILLQLYPSISLDTTDTLANPVKSCIDSSGNVYIISDPGWLDDRIIKKYDNEQNYISNFATPEAGDIVCSGNYLYVGQWCVIKQYDLNGNLIQSIGSRGTGDGQFSSISPRVKIFDGYIWGLSSTKIQKFDMEGNYISKIVKPSGIYFFTDFCFDEIGNLYVIGSDSSYYQHLLIYDTDFNLINDINRGRESYGDINYYNNYLYIGGNCLIDPDEYEYLYGVLKFDTDGNYIDIHEIDISGLIFVDPSTGNIYLSPSGYNKINVYNQSWVFQYDIGTKVSTKYVERNGNGSGIWDLTQLKKAYAVVAPSSFDPTNPSTYSEMTEYTGEDFDNITITNDGLLRFKNLYPIATKHYIYILANINSVGEEDIHHTWCSWANSSYGCSSGVGNQRNYLWFTRSPSCSEIPAGSATQYCNQLYSFEDYMTDDRTIEVSLDDFDSGIDLNTATFYYYWLYWIRVYLYSKGNDGGRTRFWVGFTDDGVKKDYNNLNEATNITTFGLPVQIYYHDENYFLYNGITDNYGWELSGINLINRILKDGTYLTTGFDTACNIERISS